MKTFAKLRRLSAADGRLLFEATLLLVLARVAIRVLPFRTIARFASRLVTGVAPADAAVPAVVERVRWAVTVGARHGPGRAVCFPQGIAAQTMLARRGVRGTLNYGIAKTANGGIEAHVWVRAGDLPVVGCAQAARFTLMTCFPPNDRAAPDLAESAP
jgi:hypothetical protein